MPGRRPSIGPGAIPAEPGMAAGEGERMTAPLLLALHERGSGPAVSVGGRTLDHSELGAAAGALARRLRGAERMAVWAEPTLETCVAVVAGLAAGVAVVPVNPRLGAAELAHVLSDCRPDAVAGAPPGALPGEDDGRPVRRLSVDLDARAPLPADDGDDERAALVVYTSGTTGLPKGAVLPRRSVRSNLDALARAWAWTGEDVLAHGLPLFHVHGLVLGLLGPLRLGSELRHLGRFEPSAAADAVASGATMLFGVPTMYHRLAAEAERAPELAAPLNRARLLVSGSAPLPAPVFDRIERLCGHRIVERYGLTETLMNTAVRVDGTRRPGYVGGPLEGVELRLLDDDGAVIDAADDETIGEVAVRGPNVFSGYLNRPDATAEAMRDGWFHTGDMATRAPDGYVRVVGRRSTDLIKTGGYKVGAGEVEVALLEHPSVADAAVKGMPDPDLGERIVAWVVAEPGAAPVTAHELADHVAGRLAPHKRPRQVHRVPELPRNAMGKVVKARLGDFGT